MAITRSWSSGALTHWDSLRVHTGDPSLPLTLTGLTRLIELYHWRRGQASPNVWLIDSASGRSPRRADDVDWSLFPMAETQHELAEHAAQRARQMLYCSALV